MSIGKNGERASERASERTDGQEARKDNKSINRSFPASSIRLKMHYVVYVIVAMPPLSTFRLRHANLTRAA